MAAHRDVDAAVSGAIDTSGATRLPGGATRRPLTLADLSFDPPCLPDQQLLAWAADLFGISGRINRLPGERDQNACITTAGGERLVLKISSARADPRVVDFHASALLYIAERDPGLPVPRMVPTRGGGVVAPVRSDAGIHQARMLTYLPGTLYQDGPPPSSRGLRGIGVFLGRLDRALEGFEHPAASDFMPWDVTNGLVLDPQFKALLSRRLTGLLQPAWSRLEHEVFPRLSSLRRQVIHQDAHGANLLRPESGDEDVSGLIDFGDMVHGPLLCEVVVTIADLVAGGRHPLDVSMPICAGFHSQIPLTDMEIGLLLDLVVARLILTLQLFEFRRQNMIHPPQFVTDDQPGIIASLETLLALDRNAFNAAIGEACR